MTQQYPSEDGRLDRGVGGGRVRRSKPPTIFVAIQPPAPWQETLNGIQQRLRSHGLSRGVTSWLNPDYFHLSLRFLGDARFVVPTPQIVAAIAPSLARIGPFHLHLGALGIFVNSQGMVVQAGVHGDVTALDMLKQTIEWALSPLGYERDTSEFHPHVTLGRVWDDADRLLPSRISHLLDFTPVPATAPYEVHRVAVIESSQVSGKLRHRVLATVPVGPMTDGCVMGGVA